MAIILQTIDLRKTYNPNTAQAAEALRGVNLDFEQGRYYAIIGKSGCGKSTLLHLLGALDRPTGGQVLFSGQDVFQLSRRELAKFRRRIPTERIEAAVTQLRRYSKPAKDGE